MFGHYPPPRGVICMMEISPFGEVHFWAHQDAAEKIMEMRKALRPEDQARVKVLAVREDS